jgi:hypothetical protein
MILAVRHQTVPNFSAFRQRAMVIDGDIRDADTLDDLCMLAVAWQIKYSGLRMAQSSGENNCDEHRGKREVPAHGSASRGMKFIDEG